MLAGQARTLRLGLLGLAVNRFSNLPYQNWCYTPTGPASAQLSVAAAVAAVRFTIQVRLSAGRVQTPHGSLRAGRDGVQ